MSGVSPFREAYRKAVDTNKAEVERVEKVWGDFSGSFSEYHLHPDVKVHLECLFWAIADEAELSDSEILTLDNPPTCMSNAVELAQRARGKLPTYEGVFPVEGIAVLHGPPKSGKTQWLIDRLFSWKCEGSSGAFRALYIALEGGRPTVASVEGHKGLQQDAGIKNPAQVVVVTPARGELHLLDVDSLKAFAKSLEPPPTRGLPKGVRLSKAWRQLGEVSYPDVVVLDTFSKALAGEDENSTAVMTKAYEGLEVLREELDARLLIAIHHPAKNGDSPRGSGALPGGVDAYTYLTRKGSGEKAVTTVTLQGAKEIPDKVSARYSSRADEWTDICKPGPEYSFIRYSPLPDAVPKAMPDTSASKATSATPNAPVPPAKAKAPPTQPKAPEGPKLRGVPLAVWKELALKPGERLALADARERVVNGPTFAEVDTARRAQRWGEVVKSFESKGLVVDGHLTHPEQPPPQD